MFCFQGDGNSDAEEIGRANKRVVREAFGSDEGSQSSLKDEVRQKKRRTRITAGSDGEERSVSQSDSEGMLK